MAVQGLLLLLLLALASSFTTSPSLLHQRLGLLEKGVRLSRRRRRRIAGEVRGLENGRELGVREIGAAAARAAIVMTAICRVGNKIHLFDLGRRKGDAGAYDADVARGLAHAQTAGLVGIRLRSMVPTFRRTSAVFSSKLWLLLVVLW